MNGVDLRSAQMEYARMEGTDLTASLDRKVSEYAARGGKAPHQSKDRGIER